MLQSYLMHWLRFRTISMFLQQCLNKSTSTFDTVNKISVLEFSLHYNHWLRKTKCQKWSYVRININPNYAWGLDFSLIFTLLIKSHWRILHEYMKIHACKLEALTPNLTCVDSDWAILEIAWIFIPNYSPYINFSQLDSLLWNLDCLDCHIKNKNFGTKCKFKKRPISRSDNCQNILIFLKFTHLALIPNKVKPFNKKLINYFEFMIGKHSSMHNNFL